MRIDQSKGAPAVRVMMGLENHVRSSGLEPALLKLVKLRASYMNGCAYCVDMHSKDARIDGETDQRIFAIPVWRETPFFTPRERAALAWTETVTDIGHTGVPDAAFDDARTQFSEQEIVDLTVGIIAINGWNRLMVSFRAEPGSYTPSESTATAAST